MDELTLRRPDDLHVHLRDGAALRDVVGATARQFARALLMPNLKPPVCTVSDVDGYASRVQAALAASSADQGFTPLYTLYLTPQTTPADVEAAAADPRVVAFKLYPAGATTNSDAGVRSLDALDAVFEAMQRLDLTLCVHGESTGAHVDVFDREAHFIDHTLAPLVDRYPSLRVVFEHITTREAAWFVRDTRAGVGATITPQHLMWNRNALFEGGLRPHNYCLPVLKREPHRAALVEAVASGSPRYFLGTDSAPHPRAAKHSECGCAGIYSAPNAMQLYATVFDQAGALDKLEGFASEHGARFYGLPLNEGTMTLRRAPCEIAATYALGDDVVVPMAAGATLPWSVVR